jgi:SSS family transporter
MSAIDWAVLSATIGVIVAYGAWKSRNIDDVGGYVLGGRSLGWATVGLSVMATQASAITFLSTPGQGFEDGMRFVQFYFGLPIAMIVISAVFLPIYYRLNVYTAYEYLEHRFDGRMRTVGALLFLIQRGLAAGITLYAPAIIISSVLGWSLTSMIWAIGPLVILYTVLGGTRVVSQTQKQQMFVILVGMIAAAIYLARGIPDHLSTADTLHTAGALGRMNIIETDVDPNSRYTVWSGLFGGFFLAMAYFGTDQSQVQRYLSARTLTQSRLGLLFNGVLKVPMQFGILLVGILLFVHHIYAPQPVWFNEPTRQTAELVAPEEVAAIERSWDDAWQERRAAADAFVAARHAGDEQAVEAARSALVDAQTDLDTTRDSFRDLLREQVPEATLQDADHVFITYVMTSLPVGLIGLLIAVILSAAMSSTASELNALGATSAMDIYRRLRPDADDKALFRASKAFTVLWGGVALLFATVASLLDNLIEAVNILGSIFYGTMLGIFALAFFVKRVNGRAAFVGAVAGQALVIYLYFGTDLGFLWYNVLGTTTVVMVGLLASFIDPSGGKRAAGAAVAVTIALAIGCSTAGCSDDPAGSPDDDADVADTALDSALDATDVATDDGSVDTDTDAPDATPATATLRYDPFGNDLITTLPDDVFTVAAEDSATGLVVRLDDTVPGVAITGDPEHDRANDLLRGAFEALDGLDGWGVNAGITFVFDGPIAEIPTDDDGRPDPDMLRLVQLGDDGPVDIPAALSTTPDGGMILTPLVPLAPATRHVVVATSALTADDGTPVDPGPVMAALLRREATGDLAPMNARYAEALGALELTPDDVAFAVVFTTQSSLQLSRDVAAAIRSADFAWTGAPACETEGAHTRCESSFTAKSWRDETGTLGDGEPVRDYELRVSTWLPEGEGPHPVALFGHGLVHDRGDAGKMARLLEPLGIAVIAIDAVIHGEHPDAPDTGSLPLFEFFAFAADPLSHDPLRLRDNFRQSSWDKLQLLRLLELDADIDGDDSADLDLDRMIYVGESFGGIMAIEFLALTDRFQLAALQLGGGAVTRIIRDARRFELLTRIAGGAEDPGGTARFFEMLQAAVDAGDAATWAPHVLRDRLEEIGGEPPHLLLQLVIDDDTIPDSSGDALVRALGLPHVPPVARDVALVETAATAPVSGNLHDGALTAGFFQFDRVRRDPESEVEAATHDYTPQSEEAEHQLFAFIEAWADGALPVIVDPYEAMDTPALP